MKSEIASNDVPMDRGPPGAVSESAGALLPLLERSWKQLSVRRTTACPKRPCAATSPLRDYTRTLRLDLTGVSTRAGNRLAESSKTASQAALAPTVLIGSIGIRPNGTCGQPPGECRCSVELVFRRVYPYTHLTPAPRVRACASLPLTSPETTP
jgi:hypothetical protein